ncbi:MAG: hypothetical protein GY789_14065 [Hyphomicrobiales bacterium]|nr:hypothetical protein [Hyphomicrobiales bacterium]
MLYHFVVYGKTANITKLSTILKFVFDKHHILVAQSLAVAIEGGAENRDKELFNDNPGSS